jgi:hypothetical protein
VIEPDPHRAITASIVAEPGYRATSAGRQSWKRQSCFSRPEGHRASSQAIAREHALPPNLISGVP